MSSEHASTEQIQALAKPEKHKNGKNGAKHLGESSVYFKVAMPKQIVKRDGRITPFEIERIENALRRCYVSLGIEPETPVEELAHRVGNVVAAKYDLPTVEGVQDIVEMVLQGAGEYDAAKHYILYRAEHAKMRTERPVPAYVRAAFAESDKYFPTQLQKFQFYDKYSRFNYDIGRRETWLETVNRAVDFLKELSEYRLPAETYERVRQGILTMKVMPSMRLLAMAGPAARRNNIAIYNCFSGEEKLLTQEYGVVPLKDAVGPVTVLNQDGHWTEAEVRSFGEQTTVELEISRFKTHKRIRVTPDHTWVLTGGQRVTTAELKPGDQIPYILASRQVNTESLDYRLGSMHGIIYGDGAQIFAQERSLGYVIRLCGDSRELLHYFPGYRVSYPPTYNGEPVVYLFDNFAKTHQLKELPDVEETHEYLVGFIRGWFAADGYVSKVGQLLFAADKEGETWLRRVGPKVGFDFGYVVPLAEQTNFGQRQKKVRNVELRRQSVTEDDLILTKHLRNYREAATDRDWKVVKIWWETESREEVFCATVPDTHTFTLADGILTGNCSYMPVDSVDSFVEALIISMSGCGVGFSVERRYVEQFPRIARQSGRPAAMHVIADSSEGWAEAVRIGLGAWFTGEDVVFDYSEVRPGGAPLRVKGGRASGPEPLRKMLDFARTRILSRQGGFLRPLDAHDMMCAVGDAAVSGGVRRTAMISLFDYDDREMLHCKDGDFWRNNSQRWNANNSAVWPERELTQTEITRFLLDMVESGRGEPGIFNRKAAMENRPARRQVAEFGTNPCVTADTWVMTDQGPRQVADLIGQPFDTVVDGRSFPSTQDGFFHTGHKPVYLLETEEGHTLQATADHPILHVTQQTRKKQYTEWRNAGDLKPGDLIRLHNQRGVTWQADDHGAAVAWLLGLLIGDGTFVRNETKSNQAILRFWGEHSQMMVETAHAVLTASVPARSDLQPAWHSTNQYWQLASTGLNKAAAHYGITADHKVITPQIEATSSTFYAGFLRGLFDADGTVIGDQKKGISVRLAQSNLELLQAVQRMLLRLGIVSTIYQERRPAGYRLMPDGHGDLKEYWTKTQYELVISNDNILTYQARIGFSDPVKAAKLSDKVAAYQRQPNRERFVARVKSITLLETMDVYDCTIPGVHAFDANGLYVHNCGEILLRPYQFCNLTSAVARAEDDLASLSEKVELATIIGTIQSMATHFPGLREEWRRNCQEERLLGVDLNGQMDSPAAQDPAVQERLREIVVETNRHYAAVLGINQSAATTCVKPSGNSSQLLNSASGLHARWAPYYVRNVRVGAHTPVCKVLRDAGVPMDPENGQTREKANTWVVHFPVKSPETAVTRNDRTALQQCEFWLQNKLHYTEHNPSVTITYQPEEVLDIIKWIWEHQDKIGGMAFLPAYDAQYDQMPYVEISRDEYEQLAAQFPDIDFSKIYRYEEEDLTTAAQEFACLSGNCDV